MRILIAEDDRITRMTLERQLRTWNHEITSTSDGEEAWQALSDGNFEIVITDWEMPRLNGVELVRRIRATPRSAYIYVILLTSRSDKADVVAGIETGADDFVSKPFDREELRVRLLAGERIVRLEQALSRQNAELRDANERMRHALRAAARVQQSMLPGKNIVTPHVRTAWQYVPTEELAGDAIGLHLLDDRYLVGYVLDVSGHGVPAALLSVSAMHALAPIPAETSLLRDQSRTDDPFAGLRRPASVAAELNRRFRAGENDGRYLTMILCLLDTLTGRLRMTSAGHPPPFLLRGSRSVEIEDAGGVPIGIMEGGDYDEGDVQLEPGDQLYLVSDGLREQPGGPEEDQFGDDRLLQALAGSLAPSLQQRLDRVLSDLERWTGSRRFQDDVSIAAIEWIGRS